MRQSGHYLLIKESIFHEDITIIKMYASNTEKPIIMKQTLMKLKRETDSSKTIAENFNNPLSKIEH